MRVQGLTYVILAMWATIMTMVGSSLMVGHWIPLPRLETTKSPWLQTLARFPSGEASGDWQAYHFLYTECPCSRRVLKHVTERTPLEGITERLVLIGENSELAEAARQLGYEVDRVAPEELSDKYGVEAAPMLVVIDPQGTTRYSGGYTSRKQVLDIQDSDIMVHLLAGEDVDPLPLYGCAVSRELQSITDPLGLKYKDK